MPFEKNREKTGGITKGTSHKKTVVKKLLAERIDDFDDTLYDVAQEYLADPERKGFAWKELLKYRLPQKRELSGEVTANINLSFINIKDKSNSTTK